MSTQHDLTPIVRQGPTHRRLCELYRQGKVAEAEEMVDDVLRLWPGTDAAATALFERGQRRWFRGDDLGALADLEMAADASTNGDARSAAYKAGLVAELRGDYANATRLYIKLMTKWPGTMLAAIAAGEVAYLGLDRPDYWSQVQLDTLQALAAHPVVGSRDDLQALIRLLELCWDDVDRSARNPAKAAGYARELLRRATARGDAESMRQADVALIAIETGRGTNNVETLLVQGCNPRTPTRALN